MLPAPSPIYSSLQKSDGIASFLFLQLPNERTTRECYHNSKLWTNISKRLFPPENRCPYLAVIQVHLWAVLYHTSGAQTAFCIAILKYDTFLNGGFNSWALDFPSPLSYLPWPKDQGQSLENTCLRHSSTPRINCPIRASGGIPQWKMRMTLFPDKWFLSRIPISLNFF